MTALVSPNAYARLTGTDSRAILRLCRDVPGLAERVRGPGGWQFTFDADRMTAALAAHRARTRPPQPRARETGVFHAAR